MARAPRDGSRRIFGDRRDAGRVLAELLDEYRGRDDVVVLGLARGGVPVAWEVAARLGVPLDTAIVRKLGAPGHEEFAVGALAGPHVVIDDELVRALRITPDTLREIIARQRRELARREDAYRGGRPPPELAGKVVILVDDGIATGASMKAAVRAVRGAGPAAVVVAVPTGPDSVFGQFRGLADAVVCARTPTPFLAVGQSYSDFGQVGDDEIRRLLATPTTPGAES